MRDKQVQDVWSYSLCVVAFLLHFFLIGFSYLPFVGFFLYFLIGLGFYHSKMWGGADVKIFAGMGAAFGPNILYIFIMLWCTICYSLIWKLVKKQTKEIPFIPVLSGSALAYMFIVGG